MRTGCGLVKKNANCKSYMSVRHLAMCRVSDGDEFYDDHVGG
jgi:hypothetical protein